MSDALEGQPARTRGKALATPSPLQERVLRFVAQGAGHGVVEATAGSGKTTTLVQVAQLLPPDRAACFLAFNRATAAELKARLPAHVEATTIHALGRKMVVQRFPDLAAASPRSDKYRDLALEVVQQEMPSAGQAAEMAEYLGRLAELTRLATAADRQAGVPAEVALRHGLESPITASLTPALQALVQPLLKLGLRELAGGAFDYTDMLYAPLMLALPPPKYAFVCVDEAQDLSPLTLALVMQLVHAGARALFVGDPQQAIYAFAGADSRSLQRITSTTGATVLPLSVSFRCPSRHVALARRYSPDMQAVAGANAGTVRIIDLDRLPRFAKAGDLIMCRVNAPLVGLQLRLAEAGTPSRVLGTDMVEPTLALAQHLFGNSLPRGADKVVAEHARDEAERLERELLTSPALAEVLNISHNRHAALGLLLRHLKIRQRLSLDELHRLAHWLLAGTQPTPHMPPIVTSGAPGRGRPPAGSSPGVGVVRPLILSTVHKAKGREAERTYLLFPEELAPSTPTRATNAPAAPPGARLESQLGLPAPPNHAPPDHDEAAEANVLFVALTRAKSELVLVERTRGALAARLSKARRVAGQPHGADELSQKWNQVLSLAELMARSAPRRK